MTRTEAQAKGLYYPTPEPIVEVLPSYLKVALEDHRQSEIRIGDFCAGKGRAVELFAQKLSELVSQACQRSIYPGVPTITTYGIEPNLSRVKELRTRVRHVLHASFFQTVIADRSFQIIFLNPPYDWDKEYKKRTGRSERMEVTFLWRATQKLCPGGIMIWIVPQAMLSRSAKYLSQWYHQITVRRFPDDKFATLEMVDKKQAAGSMVDMFDQVIVIAQRNGSEVPANPREVIRLEAMAQEKIHDLIPLPVTSIDGQIPAYVIPSTQEPITRWWASSFDPQEVARQLSITLDKKRTTPSQRQVVQDDICPPAGVWSKREYHERHWPTTLMRHLSIGRPLAPLKKGHICVLAVAGIANKAVLTGKDGRRIVVKGYSRKRVKTKVTQDDEEAKVTEKSDVFESALWCMDLTPGPKMGTLIRVETGPMQSSPFDDLPFEPMSLSAFLDQFGVALTERIAQSNPPLYTGAHQIPWARAAFAQLKRQPLGKQKDFILSVVNALAVGGDNFEPLNRAGEIAEMATGKTYLSLATLFLGDLYLNGNTHLFPRRFIGRGSRRRLMQPIHLAPAAVICPEIIAYKWKREAEITLPSVKAVVVQRIDTRAKAAEFCLFDPSWKGKSLSAIGCLDRVVECIRRDLDAWQKKFNEAKKKGEFLPLKPCHLVVIPNNTGKLGMNWTPVYRLRPVRSMSVPEYKGESAKITMQRDDDGKPLIVPCCPSCFAPIRDQGRVDRLAKADPDYKLRLQRLEQKRSSDTMDAYDEDLGESPAAYVSEEELWGGDEDKRKKRWCGACGEPLWQYTTESSGWTLQGEYKGTKAPVLPIPSDLAHLPDTVKDTTRRRYPVSDYIRKRHSGFFKLLIADEVHQGKEGSALDFSRRSLMLACNYYLALTGTLCNGYASSLKPFAYDLNPRVRRLFAYNDTAKWVDRYGRRKTTIREYKKSVEGQQGDGAMSKRKTGPKPVEKEEAGFSPTGLDCVLSCCGFLELVDVAPNLPPYEEDVEIIDMDEELRDAYTTFERKITGELSEMLVKGDKRGLAAWFQSLLGYPNLSHLGRVCQLKTGYVMGEAPTLSETIVRSKERRMLDLIQEELEQDRRVIVYVEDTGAYDIQPRYEELILKQVRPRNGNEPVVVVLRANGRGAPKTMDREQWLRDAVAGDQENGRKGCNILICNSALVQVGLDLVDFHTIIVPSVTDNTSQMRQSFRRILRPGQKKRTKVRLLVYPTMEYRLLLLMAKKMQTSLMVEGKLPGGGLVSLSAEGDDDGDFKMVLAREMMAMLEKGEEVKTSLEHGEELQAIYRTAVQMEQENNEFIGLQEEEEDQVPAPELEPITMVKLSTSNNEHPLPPVVIVPVDVTGHQWDSWLTKANALKRKRRFVTKEVVGSLWGDALPMSVVPDTAKDESPKKSSKRRKNPKSQNTESDSGETGTPAEVGE